MAFKEARRGSAGPATWLREGSWPEGPRPVLTGLGGAFAP